VGPLHQISIWLGHSPLQRDRSETISHHWEVLREGVGQSSGASFFSIHRRQSEWAVVKF